MKSRLDQKTITALALPDGKGEEFFWDDQVGRFGLRLRRAADGRLLRTWAVQYRRAGRQSRMTIGSADVLNPEQARAAAKKLLAKVDLGEDPQSDRSDRRAKDKLLFRTLAAEYLDAKRHEVRPSTLRHITGYLIGAYFKPLHAMPIDRVSRKDVAAQLVAVARQSGRAAAWQARAKLSAFFSWAMKMGLVDANPVVGTQQQKLGPARDRVLSDAELAAVWNAANGNDDYSRIIQLLILMPVRRQEAGGICWSEIDLNNETWTIPAARAKNGKAITLPLTATALEIINSVPRRAACDHLFGSPRGCGFSSWDRSKKLLDQKLATISAPWGAHDLRRTVATRLADLGTAPHVIEQILNHQSGHRGGTHGIYNRSTYEREVRAALAQWEDHIRTLIAGGERKVLSFADVV